MGPDQAQLINLHDTFYPETSRNLHRPPKQFHFQISKKVLLHSYLALDSLYSQKEEDKKLLLNDSGHCS